MAEAAPRGGPYRPAWAEVDLGALAGNVALLSELCRPAEIWAVVKADAYGHGAVPVAHAALAAGAGRVAVATVEEGCELREAGITAPILLLSEPPADGVDAALEAGLGLTVYTRAALEALLRSPRFSPPVAVHLKVDTGMHRVGADLDDLEELARAVANEPGLVLEGLWTHLASADEPAEPITALQLTRFSTARERLSALGVQARYVHAANSAGAIAFPEARADAVRTGIALYGHLPGPDLAGCLDGYGALAPVLSLKSRVHLVRHLGPGEAVSYGQRYVLDRETTIATVPIGYADGVPRALYPGGAVLVGGRRRPIAGTVTMDMVMVDCGADGDVAPGDEVVLIGRQGEEAVTAEEWAWLAGTIVYEVLTGIGPRVPRRYVGAAAGEGAHGGAGGAVE